MTQPTPFSPALSGPESGDASAPTDVDLFASHFTYSFLKGIDISGPNRPRTVNIPRRVLDDMGNMERQFWEIKAAHFNVVIFFKKGKFYELYDADAVTASREFGLKMVCDTTNRGKMRMAGVPEQSFAEWARLFVFRGYKIGRVEQMSRDEDEVASSKVKIVPRELVQILTPGTLTDPAMITGHQAHFVIGFAPVWLTNSLQSSQGTTPVLAMDAFAVDLSRNLMYRCACPSLSATNDDDTKYSIAAVLSTVACLMHHLHPKEVILPTREALSAFLRASTPQNEAVVLEALLEEVRTWMTSGSHGSHDVNEVDEANVVSWRKAAQQQQEAGASATTAAQDVVAAYFHFLKLSSVFGTGEMHDIPHFTAHISKLQSCASPAGISRSESPEAAGIGIETADAAQGGSSAPRQSILAFERYRDQGLILDTAAIDNLELVLNLKDQSEKHSVYQFLNRCVTNGGKRLMRAWLLRPSSSPTVIRERQAAIAAMLRSGLGEGWGALEEAVTASQEANGGSEARKRGREETSFKSLFSSLFGVDFERNMSRLAELKRENVRVAFVDPLVQYNKHLSLILSTVTGFQEMIMWAKEARSHLQQSGTVPALLNELLQTMIAPELSLQSLLSLFDKKKAEKSGTVIPSRGALPEYDQACDELASLEAHFNQELERMRRDYFGGDSSVAFCDIGKDLFLVEVSLNTVKKAKVPNGALVERSRTTKTVKYSVVALEDDVEQHKKATTAKANALVTVLRTIATRICEHVVVFYEASTSLSYLDCLMSLASFKDHSAGATCTPIITNTLGDVAALPGPASLSAHGIYHPLISGGAGERSAVPNDISLTSEQGRLLVLTGPNMAGKSTMMRTVAINFLVAQLGGFAFGKSFTFSPIQRIFTRIGARDATHRGQSTLMVELSETSDLLQFADCRSLCLVDELGRGTSTHDGYSIAHATLMHLSKPKNEAPLVIFSTHYHALALEVQQSKASGEAVCTQLGYMDFALVDVEQGAAGGDNEEPLLLKKRNIVFLFRLVSGICTRSYGVEVAVKAGIQDAIVGLAQRKSNELSKLLLEHQQLQLLKDFVLGTAGEAGGRELEGNFLRLLRVRSHSLLALHAE